MLKPRCGFYLTEKFPKYPLYEPDGSWKVNIPKGAVVFYDMETFINSSDEEILRYCEELIDYWNLSFTPQQLCDIIALEGINQILPKNKEKAEKILKETPNIEIVEEEKDNA